MASPQREDGHVDIANETIEALAKIYLSSYETQTLFAIFRKTYGWHKKEDWITGSQLSEMTGISESHISRTLKKLIQRNLIIKNGKKISFQKDHEKWGKLPIQASNKNEEKLPKQDIKLPIQASKVTQTGKKKLPKQVNTKETKETTTKETIQKKGDIFVKTWKDFKIMRKTIKKPMTDKAEELLLINLDKLSSDEKEQVAILNQSILNCWQGVYALKDKPQDDESQSKWEKKEVPRLTPEQIKENLAQNKAIMDKLKGKFNMPETKKGIIDV